MNTQDILDYLNDAQHRVVATTLVLQESRTVTIPVGGVVALSDDVIMIDSISRGMMELPQLSDVAYDLTSNVNAIGEPSWGIVGRTLYVLPVPSEAFSVVMNIRRRPVEFTSVRELEIDGELDAAAKRLVTAYVAMDGGEPEVSQNLLGEYQQDVNRLRRTAQTMRTAAPRWPA